MARFPLFAIALVFSFFTTQLAQSQSLFLDEGTSGFTLGGGITITSGNLDAFGEPSYSFGGRADLSLTIGTANLGSIASSNGSLVAPGFSYLVVKDKEGFNLSLGAAYAFYSFQGSFFNNLEEELEGITLAVAGYQAVELDDNNAMFPFASIGYNEPVSTAVFSLGIRFATGLNNRNIFNMGPSISFSDGSTSIGLGLGLTFSGKGKEE